MFGYRLVTYEYLESLKEGAKLDQEMIGELEAEKDRLKRKLKALRTDLRHLAAEIDIGEAKDFTEKAVLGIATRPLRRGRS